MDKNLNHSDYHTLTIDVPKSVSQNDLIKAVDMLLQKRARKAVRELKREREHGNSHKNI